MTADHLNRREEDRDHHLISRLDRLEVEVSNLRMSAVALDNKSALIESEQRHLKELIDAKFQVITQTQVAHGVKFDMILTKIEKIIMEPAHMPGLQALLDNLNKVARDQNANAEKIEGLSTWQHRVDGVLFLLKFVGAAGLFAFVVSILRLLKIIP